jgi:hypothetical protein
MWLPNFNVRLQFLLTYVSFKIISSISSYALFLFFSSRKQSFVLNTSSQSLKTRSSSNAKPASRVVILLFIETGYGVVCVGSLGCNTKASLKCKFEVKFAGTDWSNDCGEILA